MTPDHQSIRVADSGPQRRRVNITQTLTAKVTTLNGGDSTLPAITRHYSPFPRLSKPRAIPDISASHRTGSAARKSSHRSSVAMASASVVAIRFIAGTHNLPADPASVESTAHTADRDPPEGSAISSTNRRRLASSRYKAAVSMSSLLHGS
jgi:hypothetical protein